MRIASESQAAPASRTSGPEPRIDESRPGREPGSGFEEVLAGTESPVRGPRTRAETEAGTGERPATASPQGPVPETADPSDDAETAGDAVALALLLTVAIPVPDAGVAATGTPAATPASGTTSAAAAPGAVSGAPAGIPVPAAPAPPSRDPDRGRSPAPASAPVLPDPEAPAAAFSSGITPAASASAAAAASATGSTAAGPGPDRPESAGVAAAQEAPPPEATSTVQTPTGEAGHAPRQEAGSDPRSGEARARPDRRDSGGGESAPLPAEVPVPAAAEAPPATGASGSWRTPAATEGVAPGIGAPPAAVRPAAVPAAPAAPATPPATPPRMEILEQVRMHLSPTRPEVDVVLSPPELGRLLVRLEVHGGGVHATITADEAKTARELAADMPRLVQMLDEAGIKVAGVEVRTGGPPADGRGAAPDAGNAGQEAPARDRGTRADRDPSAGSPVPGASVRPSRTATRATAAAVDLVI